MAANAEHERFLTLFQRMVDHTDAWIAKTPPDKLDWVPIQTSAMRFGDRVSRVTIKGLIAHIVVGEAHWAHSLARLRRWRDDAAARNIPRWPRNLRRAISWRSPTRPRPRTWRLFGALSGRAARQEHGVGGPELDGDGFSLGRLCSPRLPYRQYRHLSAPGRCGGAGIFRVQSAADGVT